MYTVKSEELSYQDKIDKTNMVPQNLTVFLLRETDAAVSVPGLGLINLK